MKKRECITYDKKLYKIGLFAQMNRVSVKTLRYYDDVQLLKPEMVDEISGYRYYTSKQMPILHKILALRDLDFSIEEIRQIFDGESEEYLLRKKKKDLLHVLANASKKIASIETYLMSQHLYSDYRVVMKSLPEVMVASMKVHLNHYAELADKMLELGAIMEEAECECTETDYCFTIYYDEEYRESDINAEICEAITELKENRKGVIFKKLPQVELAACALHKGSYETLPLAYTNIVNFIEESGYEIIGQQRESYIDGMWNKDSEEEWLTEIQFPIRKIDNDNLNER